MDTSVAKRATVTSVENIFDDEDGCWGEENEEREREDGGYGKKSICGQLLNSPRNQFPWPRYKHIKIRPPSAESINKYVIT